MFGCDLWIPTNEISKSSYIRYDIKSLKVIEESIWDHPPLIWEIDSNNEIQLKLGQGSGNIKEFFIISCMHQ